jgi:hypothetical protein
MTKHIPYIPMMAAVVDIFKQATSFTTRCCNEHFNATVKGYIKNAPKPKKKTKFVMRQQAAANRFKNRGQVIWNSGNGQYRRQPA